VWLSDFGHAVDKSVHISSGSVAVFHWRELRFFVTPQNMCSRFLFNQYEQKVDINCVFQFSE